MRSRRSQCVAKWESDYRVVLGLRPAHDGDAEAAAASKPGKRPRKRNQSQKAPKAVKQRGPFEKLDKVITISRQLPTIQLVDAVWANTFDWLSHINKKSCDVPPETIFQICHCGKSGQAISVSRSHAGRQAVVCHLLERDHWHLPRKCIRHADDRKLPQRMAEQSAKKCKVIAGGHLHLHAATF